MISNITSTDMRYHRKNIFRDFLYATILSQPLIFSSCAEDSLSWLVDTPIKVTAAVDQPTTRSGANIQTGNFEAGETINGYFNISGGDAIGKIPTVLTTSAPDESGKNRLSPDVQPYYPSSSDGNVDIMALYPPSKATNTITSFAVEADQTADANYMLSDLMWAGITNQAKTTSDINLQFSHLMAKMSVTVTGKEGVRIDTVKLINSIRTVPVTLSASGYTLGSVGTESDSTKMTIVLARTISTDLNNQLSGSVLLPPQTIGGNFIEVETNYGTAYYSAFNKEFKEGEAYSTDIVVKRQDIGYTTTITNWVNNDGSIAVPPGSSAGLKITAIPDQQYNGSARTPELTIKYTPNDELNEYLGTGSGYTYDLRACTQNEDGSYNNDGDYIAEYFNNVNQGTAVVIITGRADGVHRTSEKETVLANVISQIKSMTSFNITAAIGTINYPSTSLEVEYDYNTTVDFELNKNGGDGKFTYESSNPTVADVTVSGIVTIRSAGSTTITANMDNSGNYSAATAYYDLTVKPRSLKNHTTGDNPDITATLAATSFPYAGVAYSPAVVVKDNGRTLQENKHYTYSVVDNTNIGTATITIRGMGNYSNADADIITRTFTITAITPDITFDNTAVIVPKGQKYTRRAKTDYGTITYSANPSGYVTITSDGVVTATNTAANSQPQTVTITASVAADATNGDWVAASKSYQLTVVESEWSYVYSGGQIQTWTCPVDGVYQLEAMGAQGATTDGFNGGRGADVAGQVFIKKGQILYIYLGQGGEVHSTTRAFNGGGCYTASTADGATARFTGGGGATDFALKNATWNSEDHLYSRILVAGGGGGALYYGYQSDIHCGGGGNGGGEKAEGRAEYAGETGYGGSHPGGGGTLSAGGAIATGGTYGNAGTFGNGGNYGGSISAGCGGGGWFGGASGSTGTRQGAGGGGSSFIYNTDNINASGLNYRGLLRTPTSGNFFDPATLEITPSNLVSGGSPDANGQARIIYMSAE